MFRWLFTALVAAALPVAAPASAQDLIAEYFAMIAPRDMVNSSGEPLGDWCGMIQQDRANYHRFGLRDSSDQGDPVFASRDVRAEIAGNCQIVPGSEYIPGRLEGGEPRYVWVKVYGYGERPVVLVVSEGAG